MAKYFRFFNKSLELDVRTFLNMFLFYFRKIPLLKYLASGNSYRMKGPKEFFSFLGPVAIVIFHGLKNLLKYGLISFIVFSYALIFDAEEKTSEILITVFLIYNLFKLNSFYIKKNKNNIFTFYEFFNVDPKISILTGVFLNYFLVCLGKFFSFLIIGRVINVDTNTVLFLILIDYFTYVIYNGVNLFLIDKNILKAESNLGLYFSILLTIIFSVLLFISEYSAINIVNNIFLILIIGILFIFIGLYQIKYRKYSMIISKYDVEYDNRSKQEKNIQKSVELKSEDLDTSKKYLEDNLEGYNLLNELFFQRHRRLILKPILVKAGILSVIFLATLIIKFIPNGKFPVDLSIINENLLLILIRAVPFIAYISFFNETISRIMFMNCDQSLMQYGFYRRPKDLLKMFTLRLKKLSLWNSLPFIVFLIFIIIYYLMGDLSLYDSGIFILEFGALWIFFSIHTLFIYYVFQPYNDKYEMKSPIYFVINMVVYWACYQVMQLDLMSNKVAIYFIIAAIIYSILALILVYNFAPKTFKPNLRT